MSARHHGHNTNEAANPNGKLHGLPMIQTSALITLVSKVILTNPLTMVSMLRNYASKSESMSARTHVLLMLTRAKWSSPDHMAALLAARLATRPVFMTALSTND